MKRTCTSAAFVAMTLPFIGLTVGAQEQTCTPASGTTCSLTAVNQKDCWVYVDRNNPAAPPTIYMARGKKVHVVIVNPSPFEKLHWDQKSIATTPPADSSQAVATALTTGLGKIVLSELTALPLTQPQATLAPFVPQDDRPQTLEKKGRMKPKPADKPEPTDATLKEDLEQAASLNGTAEEQLAIQKRISTDLPDAVDKALNFQGAVREGFQKSLHLIRIALQMPPGNLCTDTVDEDNPWRHFSKWKEGVIAGLRPGEAQVAPENLDPIGADIDSIVPRIKYLQDGIKLLKDHAKEYKNDKSTTKLQALLSPLQDNVKALQGNQVTLTAALKTARKALQQQRDRMEDFLQALAKIQPDAKGYEVPDGLSADPNDQLETYNLTAENLLSVPAKVFAGAPPADPLTGLFAKADLTTPPTLTSLTTVKVQFLTPARFEVSAGVLYPFEPYHSYSVVPTANTATTMTGVIQESKNYTVVPTANISYVLRELMLGAKKQRAAWLASGSIGYNSSTSAVEFGVGPSFSWRAFEFSGMADFGRDTKLTGGYGVNGVISSTFTAPPTMSYWSVKAAVALTVRLPLGGAH